MILCTSLAQTSRTIHEGVNYPQAMSKVAYKSAFCTRNCSVSHKSWNFVSFLLSRRHYL